MTFYQKIINLLHKDDRHSLFYQMLAAVIAEFFNEIEVLINKIYMNFYFNTLDADGCEYFENLLKITPKESQTIEDRRANIRAKWLSNAHNKLELIQQVCDSWRGGTVIADFIDGVIDLTFIDGWGIPDDFESLVSAIDEIKPAHIGVRYRFKYLLIRDIHEVKTITEMENLTINQFMSGREY